MEANIDIICAGPAGLGWALALARRGTSRSITVYDRAEDHDTAPALTGPSIRLDHRLYHRAWRTRSRVSPTQVAERFDKELLKFAGIIRGVHVPKQAWTSHGSAWGGLAPSATSAAPLWPIWRCAYLSPCRQGGMRGLHALKVIFVSNRRCYLLEPILSA